MIDVNKAVIARLRKGNEEFEILVDCDKALAFKENKADLDDALATNGMIFKDVKKGLKASEHEIKRIFNTTDPKEVASVIIKNGEIQLTAEHRNKLREEKKRRIIEMLHRNTINTQNNLPHPPQRIEAAIEQAKVKIDEFKRPEEQLNDVLEKINLILPIKLETRELSINVPAQYAGRTFPILKRLGKLRKENWQNNGSLLALIDIPAGIQEELENQLNKLSHGEVEIKILGKR